MIVGKYKERYFHRIAMTITRSIGMKKGVQLLIIIIACIGSIGCGMEKIDEQNMLFSIREVQGKYIGNSNEIALIDLKPCILVDGKAYIYDDDWKVIENNSDIIKVYNGDTFCALDFNGKIINIKENDDNYENYPLTSAAVYYNAEEMMKFVEKEKISLLNANPLKSIYCIIYSDDRHTRLFVNGQMYELADSLDVVDISGNFILDKSGNVYKVLYGENLSNVRLEQISNKRYIRISACNSADRCIGIDQDGGVMVWSDVDLGFTFNAENAKFAAMGFDYGVVLRNDGKIEFHSANQNLEKQVANYFYNLNEKVVAITCDYNYIAIMLQNGNVNVITML